MFNSVDPLKKGTFSAIETSSFVIGLITNTSHNIAVTGAET